MKTSERHKCLNCNNTFKGNYCPYCGQSADTHRFQTRDALSSVLQTFWGSDNKFLNTCYLLLSQPGTLVRNFLLGKRQKYFRPIPMLFFLMALYAALTFWMDDVVTPYDDISIASEEMSSESPTMSRVIDFVNNLFQNKIYAALLDVLYCILPFKYFFRHYTMERLDGTKEPLNLAEHFFALVYIACINMILAFFALPFLFIPDSVNFIRALFFILPNLVCISMYSEIYRIKWWKSAWINVIAILTGTIAIMLAILFCFGLVVGIEHVMR